MIQWYNSAADPKDRYPEVSLENPLPVQFQAGATVAADVNVRDAAGNNITSSVAAGAKRGLDVTIVGGNVTLQATDIRIGGVEIEDRTSGLRANVSDVGGVGALNVTGSVSIGNFPATQAVTGTFWQETQPVSGSISVSNFPATQPVSGSISVSNFPATQAVSGTIDVGNFPATQAVSGSVSVSNFPATQAVTGTFWQATQPVSGSVSVSNLPASYPVTGTFWQETQPVSGSVTVSGSVSVSNFPATQAVSGTFWQETQPVSGSISVSNFPATQVVSGTVTANIGTLGAFESAPAILEEVRDILANLHFNGEDLKTSASFTGTLDVGISEASDSVLIYGNTGTANKKVKTTDDGRLEIVGYSLPLPSGAATESGLTNIQTAIENVGDKIPSLGQKAAESAITIVLASDHGNVPVSGSVSVSNFPASYPVTGTFWQATQPVSGSISVSNFPATQAVTGTFWQETQPISGSVSATQGTANWSTNLTQYGSTAVGADNAVHVQPGTAASWAVTNANLDAALSTRLAETTFTGRFSAGVAIADAAAIPATTKVGSVLMGYNGATLDMLRSTIANGLVVDVSRSALPTGAATSANQTTANSSLSSIDGKLPATLGQKASAASMSVVLASDQPGIANTPTAESPVTWATEFRQTGTGSFDHSTSITGTKVNRFIGIYFSAAHSRTVRIYIVRDGTTNFLLYEWTGTNSQYFVVTDEIYLRSNQQIRVTSSGASDNYELVINTEVR